MEDLKHKSAEKGEGQALSAAFIGVARHRMGRDGKGVTTLAAFHGCSLHCQYCLNPACLDSRKQFPRYTPEQLYDKTAIDNLYFLATGGGICFGGGEPLLQADFICRFREICNPDWKITVETSLSVPPENLQAVAAVTDAFIVDIKDTNDTIYQAYTGRSNRQALSNLEWLLQTAGAERVMVRVPLIPGFNSEPDRQRSVELLQAMGVRQLDCFTYRVKE